MDPLPEFALPVRTFPLTEDSTLTVTSPLNALPYRSFLKNANTSEELKPQSSFFNSKVDVHAAFRRSSAARNKTLKDAALAANVLVPQRPANAEFNQSQLQEVTLTNYDLEHFLQNPRFRIAVPDDLEFVHNNRRSLSRLSCASHNAAYSEAGSEYNSSELSCQGRDHRRSKSIVKHDKARRLPVRYPKLAMQSTRCPSCAAHNRVTRHTNTKDQLQGGYTPPLLQPYEPCGAYNPLTPVASRSLLTCNREFQQQFPNVYTGLCKGLLDISRLMVHEVVIPVKETVTVHKNAVR